MADDNGATGSGIGYGDDFNDLDLNALSAMIDADAAQVPAWRQQAGAYRGIAKLIGWHKTEFDTHREDINGAWRSPGADVFFTEAAPLAESLRLTAQDAGLNAEALDKIATTAAKTKTRVDAIKNEWNRLESQYQQNPHIFDGYSADGGDGYQAAKGSYLQSARDEMRKYSEVAVQATLAGMHSTGDYKGPVYGRSPVYPVSPRGPESDGSGRTYPTPTASDSEYTPAASSGPGDTWTPTPDRSQPPARPGSPVVEFPVPGGSVTLPAPGTGVIAPPSPATPPGGGAFPLPGAGPFPPGGFPGAFPGGRPPMAGGPGFLPGQRGTSPFAPGANVTGRATEPVLGSRPGAGAGRPGTVPGGRTGAAARPGPPKPERGVIRNPNAAGSAAPQQNRRRDRRDEDRADAYASDVIDNELLEDLPLDAGPDVLRPAAERKVRRSDAGPVFGRGDRRG